MHLVNSRFRVVIADARLPNREREIEELSDIADVVQGGVMSRKDLFEAVATADAILTELTPVDAELLDHAPNLRGVVVYGVGTERVDLEAAHQRGVVVANTPDAFTWEVAEHAIALLMALGRRLTTADRDVRDQHQWNTYDDTHQPRLLRDMTLGVLGYGRIGRATATLAAGLGMSLLVFDPYVPPEQLTLAGGKDMHVAASLEELLQSVDALTLHVPLTDANSVLIGASELACMRPRALLVNVSRGGLIDHAALRTALASGALGGAGLDVFETEPPDFGHPLLCEPNVIVTPHLAWKSESSALRCELQAVAEVRRILRGEQPRNRVI
jgi:phosphoglycerate dehydrogenase-like enzyme